MRALKGAFSVKREFFSFFGLTNGKFSGISSYMIALNIR